MDDSVILILTEARNNLERLTKDIREWLQYAKYLRGCKEDSSKIAPTQIGIETSEKLIGSAYKMMERIKKHIEEPS